MILVHARSRLHAPFNKDDKEKVAILKVLFKYIYHDQSPDGRG